MVMQPNQPSQAPPPIDPSQMPQQANNPYGFITNPGVPQKKSALPLPSGKAGKAIIILLALILVIIIWAVVANLMGQSEKKYRADYIKTIKQQKELIRISEIGLNKATTADARNLAITTQLTLTSEQKAIAASAKTMGIKLNSVTLANSDTKKNDELFKNAEQFNRFDDVFTKALQEDLTEYAKTVQVVYKGSTSKKTKDALAKQYKTAALLANYKEDSTQ